MRGSWFCTERIQREDMTYLDKIVLVCRTGYVPAIDALVEDFVRDRVAFVGVVGQDCCKVEDIIDEIVVGDGTRESLFHADIQPSRQISRRGGTRQWGRV